MGVWKLSISEIYNIKFNKVAFFKENDEKDKKSIAQQRKKYFTNKINLLKELYNRYKHKKF